MRRLPPNLSFLFLATEAVLFQEMFVKYKKISQQRCLPRPPIIAFFDRNTYFLISAKLILMGHQKWLNFPQTAGTLLPHPIGRNCSLKYRTLLSPTKTPAPLSLGLPTTSFLGYAQEKIITVKVEISQNTYRLLV